MVASKSRIGVVFLGLSLAVLSIVFFYPALVGSAEGATGGPWVKVKTVAGPVSIASSDTTVASLPLPAGKYLVLAKVVAVANPSQTPVSCHLVIGGQVDDSSTELQDRETIVLTAAGYLGSPGSTTVSCRQSGAGASAVNVKITATRVGTLTNI